MGEQILKSTRRAYGEALVELGERNERIVVLDADLSKSTYTNLFAKKFPNRFFNMGISECKMISCAAGLATTGKIPFASSFAVFAAGRAWEMVRLSVGYTNLNVKIAASHAGISVGEDGPTHHCAEDIALMRVIPNMTVLVPADATETKKAVFASAEWQGPVYIRLGRPDIPIIFDDSYDFQIGKAYVLKEGKDVSILACGLMVWQALQALELLEKEGIEAELVNVSTIKPLDEETILRSLSKTRCAVSAEEHNIIGGLGSAVAELITEKLPIPLERVGVKDRFAESGPWKELLKKYGLTPEDIKQAALRAIERKEKGGLK
ncbi:transketolase family protein [bacterium]|nr:transketolase family protein [bacterium]